MFLMVVFVASFFTGVFLYQMLEASFLLTVRSKGSLFCISLGRSSRYCLNNMTEHLSSIPVVNILVPTNLIFSVYCFCDYTRSRADVYIDLFSKVIQKTP